MAAIRITLDPVAPRAQVGLDGELAEHHHVWVWDLFCAATLHELDADGRAALRERLEHWAVDMAGQMFAPEATLRETATAALDDIVELDPSLESGVTLVLATTETDADWPGMEIDTPDATTAAQRSTAVLALARYLMEQNTLFIRELPVHILALRKYYTDVRAPDDAASVEEAPVFALAKASELFAELSGSGG